MSAEYKDQDLLDIAQKAEEDLNSHAAKHGHSTSDTGRMTSLGISMHHLLIPTVAVESGVDSGITAKFPGSTVVEGSAASGAGDNREIPIEEGGDIDEAGK